MTPIATGVQMDKNGQIVQNSQIANLPKHTGQNSQIVKYGNMLDDPPDRKKFHRVV